MIKSIVKNGIFLPEDDIVLCLTDVAFTRSYGEYYFYSDSYPSRSFLLKEKNKTWYTSFAKAAKMIIKKQKEKPE